MQVLPLIPSVREYTFDTVLDDRAYTFRVYWNACNARDAAWFFDVYDEDAQPIAYGVKIVLGTNLARTYDHPLTRQGALVVIDRSGSNIDATFDDLGTRIAVLHLTSTEMAGAVVAGL